MSLSTCLRKAGESIAREDKVAILAKAKELRESGLGNQTAARKAVLELLDGSRATLVKMHADAGLAEPDFARKEKERPEPREMPADHEVAIAPRLDAALRRWGKGEGGERDLAAAIQRDQQIARERRELAAERDRARGPKWVQQRLLEAERHGEIPEETGEFARWLLQHSPHLAEDLALTVRERGGGARGVYNPAERLVTLFRSADVQTGVHEILHHTERMMPPEVQDGIRREWQEAVKARAQEVRQSVLRRPTDLGPEAARNQAYLRALDAMDAAASAGHGELARRLYQGQENSPLPPLRHLFPYELSSPSEFWAVNGARLMGDRYDARHTWVERARQWLDDLMQFVRSRVGLKSNAALLRGLESVISGDGTRVPRASMLENSTRPLHDEPSEPAFARKDQDERDLIIQHNLTAENLLHAERMGGIPVPSLAITKAEHPSTNFGEITLLGDKAMATPSKDMKVFGADIYSPRYPQITYKLDSSALKRLNEKLAPFRKPSEGADYRAGNREIYGGEIDKQDDLLSREDFKKWAAANGVEKDGYHQLRAAATQLLSDVGAGERIFQGFTNSGNRKYVEHTLDRVVSILKKELRGGEGFNYGAGSLRAKFTPQFKTLNSIRLSKDRLMTAGNFDKLKDEINKELLDLAYDMVPNGGFRSSETAMSILEDAPKMGLDRAAKEYGIELSQDIKDRAYAFMDKLRTLPTAYFEAKALRAMQLGEFKAAVVPHDTDPKVRAALEKNGVAVHEYKRGDDADREAVIAKASAETPDVRFSKKSEEERRQSHGFHTREIQVDGKWRPIEDSSGRLLARGDFRGQQNFHRWFKDSVVTDERGRPQVVYHGTTQDFSAFDSSWTDLSPRADSAGLGFYFTKEPMEASGYGAKPGGSVMPVYLSVKKPYTAENTSDPVWQRVTNSRADAKAARKSLIEQGYDGFITPHDEIVAFNPEQIKSAIGNRGTFSDSDPDIRFARKGQTSATAEMPESAPGIWGKTKTFLTDGLDKALTKSEAYKWTAPLSAGSVRAQAEAQKAANLWRLADQEWLKVQTILTRAFPDKEARKRMWDAADEENDIRSGRLDPAPDRGLDSLTKRQRDVVEQLHAYGEELWDRATRAGMVTGEGMKYWTPRMMAMVGENGEVSRPTGKQPDTAGGEGRNIFTSTGNIKERKHDLAADTEAAMQAKGGTMVRDILTMPLAMQRLSKAIASRELINQIRDMGRLTDRELVATDKSGDPGFFTIPDHPAFTIASPEMTTDTATGKRVPKVDQNGDMVFKRTPLYMSTEFEGPLRSIMSGNDGVVYKGLMLLKSKAMSAIMFSPLTHNMTIFGRAMGYDPTIIGTGKLYLEGHAARKDDGLMQAAIKGGMVPMGYQKNGMIDITDVARSIGREGGYGDPHESWIGLGMRDGLGLVNKELGANAKGAWDALGKLWHGTLLWERVADLQMGVFSRSYAKYQAKGFPDSAAAVMAAHLANRYGGVVAKENMSELVRKSLNILLFSRLFNLGNLGAVKDLGFGMSSGLRAMIEHEHGRAVADRVNTEMRKKAWGAFIADAGMSLLWLSLFGSLADYLLRDKDMDAIIEGYKERAGHMGEAMKNHPFNPKSYSPWQLSPTHDNEPGKEDRIDLGEIPGAGGRHEYQRLPTGKVVEDLFNWMQHAPTTFHSKMSPLAKAAWESITNDKGNGVPVYDPTAKGPEFVSKLSRDVLAHLVTSQLPWDTVKIAWDKLHGKATQIESDKFYGQLTGFTYSQGHPQGPEAGIAAEVEKNIQTKKMMAMEQVKNLLKYDKEDEARQKLEDVGLTPREVNAIIKRIQNPREGMSSQQRRKFNSHSSEEDQQRMDRVTR